jgi:TonB family protein
VKAILIIIISLVTGFVSFSKSSSPSDTIYYNKYWKETTKNNSTYYRLTNKDNGLYAVKDYYSNGALQMEGSYSSLKRDIKEGKFTWYYKNGNISKVCEYINNEIYGVNKSYYESGQIKEEGYYVHGEPDGIYKSYYKSGHVDVEAFYKMGEKNGVYKFYYESGRIYCSGMCVMGKKDGEFLYYYDEDSLLVRRKENYSIDELKAGYCYTPEGKDTTYFPYIEIPEFPGGEKSMKGYLAQELSYPEDARESGIEGRVVVRFTVLKTGKIDSIEILKGVYPSLDEMACYVVRMMPRWEPGKQEGIPVNVWYNLPIMFKLE